MITTLEWRIWLHTKKKRNASGKGSARPKYVGPYVIMKICFIERKFLIQPI